MKKNFFAFVLAMNAFFSWAQNVPQFPAYNYNLVPPSPEVAALAKFGEHNLSYATGKPTISVPLYTIKSGSLTVPVSLDYSPGGIRVDEISSSAGLGWALSAGGMISRTVVGMGDDYPVSGFLDNEDKAPLPLYSFWQANIGTGAAVNIIDQISNNELDVEPDKYFFNLPGKAGRFTINVDDEKVYTIPFEKVNIAYERTPVAGFTEIFTRWIVTTPDGIRYVYGRRMNNEQTVYAEANLNVRTDVRTQSRSETTAWFLREIISADNADTVVFNYTVYNTGYCNQLSITKRLSPLNQYDCLPEEEKSYSRNDVSSYIISEITGRFGKVEFTYEDNRQDLHGGKRLKYVTVFNKGSQQTQKFELAHSYFTSNKYPPLIPIPCPSNYTGSQSQRLKLDSLREVAVSGQVLTRKFTYDYNEQTGRILPNRLSNAQDDWGYYNGINNTTLIPRYPAYATFDVLSYVLDGAIREPSENFTKIGTLTGITYPTGGRTVYEYEQNDAWGRDFLHEVALPNENIPYVEYAHLESNTALDPGFPGFQLESAPFTVDNSTYQRSFSYFQIGFNHPNYQVGGCDYESHGAQPCRIGVYLIDVINNTSTTIAPGSLIRLLPNSVYKLRMQVMDKTEYSADAVAYVKGPATHPGFYNKKIGGLRIKTISDYDGSSLDPVLKKRYKYLESDGTTSSGKLNFYPSYHSSVFYSNPGLVGGGTGQGCQTNTNVFQRTANSMLPLTTFAGSPVTYSRVEAYQEGNGNAKLKSVYHFTSEGDIWGGAVYYPFPPPTSLEHRRGLPTLEEHFKQTDIGYDIVSSKQTIYRQWCLDQDGAGNPCPNMKWHYGLKIVPRHYQIDASGNPNLGMNLYRALTEWVIPEETRERTYSSPTTYLEKKTTYSYDNPSHGQITQVKTFESNSDKIITDFKYSDDYANFTSSSDPQANAIKNIKNGKALFPIEKLTIKENQAGDKFVTGGSILYYKSTSIRPDVIYSLDVFNPIPLTSFTRSYIDGSNVFIKDSRYRKFATYTDYDVYGNVMNTNKENDINYAYIFDYNGLYPVCQVQDATTQQIAYTSFEAENKGYWTYSGTPSTQSDVPTGEKAYLLSSGNTLTRSGLSSSTVYIVSYWKKGGPTPYTVSGNQSGSGYPITGVTVGDWTYIKHKVTGVTSVSISSASDEWIDEVRLYPLGAQMQTYTYDPLVGMLTQSDQNDRITYYDYDEFNRLRLIKDFQRKILKKICYNYNGQPEDCGVPIN